MRAAGWVAGVLAPFFVGFLLIILLFAAILWLRNACPNCAAQSFGKQSEPQAIHFRRHCTPSVAPPCVPSVQAASVDAIVRACTRYGIEGQAGEMIAVCYRESRLDPNAINPRSGALGLPQWMPATWNEIRWRMNRPCLNPARAEDSAEAMAWCWKHNLSKHWRSK